MRYSRGSAIRSAGKAGCHAGTHARRARRADSLKVPSMHYLRIVLLLLAVTVGTQACFVVVGPARGRRGGHHHGGGWG